MKYDGYDNCKNNWDNNALCDIQYRQKGNQANEKNACLCIEWQLYFLGYHGLCVFISFYEEFVEKYTAQLI